MDSIVQKLAVIRIRETAGKVSPKNDYSFTQINLLNYCTSQQFQLDRREFYKQLHDGGSPENKYDPNDEELAKAFSPPIPPAWYICDSCNQRGHYIKYCTKVLDNFATSYKGPRRSVGEFQCSKCKRVWISSNFYAGEKQQCRKCKVLVVPRKQFSIEKAAQCGVTSKIRRSARTSSMSSVATTISCYSLRSSPTVTSSPVDWSLRATPSPYFDVPFHQSFFN